MAGPPLLRPGLPPLLLLLLPLLPPVLPGDAAPSRCRLDQFQCTPGAPCFPRDWLCDGHPDCEDDKDEFGCGTETATAAEPSPGGPAVTPPRSSAVPPAEPSATPKPKVSVLSRSQGYMWILIVAGTLLISSCWLLVLSSLSQDQASEWVSACALSSPALLIILVAAGSVFVWGLSKAKCRSDTFSLEKASREQLMPDKSQKGSLP